MNANLLLKNNIDALLRKHGQTRKDLAQWCRRSESWISKIYKETRRGFSIRDLDRMADLWGMRAYQLFLPGISTLTERRTAQRRVNQERRIGYAQLAARELGATLDAAHPRRKVAHVEPSPAAADAIRAVTEETERKIANILAADARRQAASARPPVTAARVGSGNARGPHAHARELKGE